MPLRGLNTQRWPLRVGCGILFQFLALPDRISIFRHKNHIIIFQQSNYVSMWDLVINCDAYGYRIPEGFSNSSPEKTF